MTGRELINELNKFPNLLDLEIKVADEYDGDYLYGVTDIRGFLTVFNEENNEYTSIVLVKK